MAGGVPLGEALPFTCWIMLVCIGYSVQVDAVTSGNSNKITGYTTNSNAVAMTPMDMGLWITLGMAGLIILILTVVILLIIFRRRVCKKEGDPEDIISPEEVPTSIDRKPSADNVYDELPEEEDTGYDPAVLPSSDERPPSYRTAIRSQNVPSQTETITANGPLISEPTANEFPHGQEDVTDMSRHSSYDNIPGMGLESYIGIDENDEEISTTKADDNVNDNNETPSVEPVYAVIDKTKKKKNRDSGTSDTTELGEVENGIQPASVIDSVPSLTSTVNEGLADVRETKQSRVRSLIESLQS